MKEKILGMEEEEEEEAQMRFVQLEVIIRRKKRTEKTQLERRCSKRSA
jgi:hypothetical protein